jgi:hypothetical protein
MRPAFTAIIEAVSTIKPIKQRQAPAPRADINWPIAGGAAAAGLMSNSAMHAKEARRGAYMLKSPRIGKGLANNIRKEMVHDVKYARGLKLGALGVGAGTLGIYLADKYLHNRNK